jgi:O-antigen/teichoic acid export membrane protein
MGSGSSAVLGLLGFALMARSLTKEELGLWVVFISIFTLFDMLRAGLLSSAVIKRISEHDDEHSHAKIIGSAWALSLLITLGISLLIFILYLILRNYINDPEYLFIGQWFWLPALLSIPGYYGNMGTQCIREF